MTKVADQVVSMKGKKEKTDTWIQALFNYAIKIVVGVTVMCIGTTSMKVFHIAEDPEQSGMAFFGTLNAFHNNF